MVVLWYFCGIFCGCFRFVCGMHVLFLWYMCGILLTIIRYFFVVFMEYACGSYCGIYVICLWHVCGILCGMSVVFR